MNTSAHAIVNLAILGKYNKWKHSWYILLGAVLPDAFMFVFYIVERFIRNESPRTIWQERYFDPQWQAYFDVFNSFPLLLFALLVAVWRKWQMLQLVVVSMLLHALLDFPLHREDAHHHFFPFSDYQFISPVSYWDSNFYGTIFFQFEILLTFLLSVYCFMHIKSLPIRVVIVAVNVLYVSAIASFIFFL